MVASPGAAERLVECMAQTRGYFHHSATAPNSGTSGDAADVTLGGSSQMQRSHSMCSSFRTVCMEHSFNEHGGESATTRVRLRPSLPLESATTRARLGPSLLLTPSTPSVLNPPWPPEFVGMTGVAPPSLLLPMQLSPPWPLEFQGVTSDVVPLLPPSSPSLPMQSSPPWPLRFKGVTLDVVPQLLENATTTSVPSMPPSPSLPMLLLPPFLLLPMPPSSPMPQLPENATTTSVLSMPPLPLPPLPLILTTRSLLLMPSSSDLSPQSPPPQQGGHPTTFPNITTVQHVLLHLDTHLGTFELGGIGWFFGMICLVALLLEWLCLLKWSYCWPLPGSWLKAAFVTMCLPVVIAGDSMPGTSEAEETSGHMLFDERYYVFFLFLVAYIIVPPRCLAFHWLRSMFTPYQRLPSNPPQRMSSNLRRKWRTPSPPPGPPGDVLADGYYTSPGVSADVPSVDAHQPGSRLRFTVGNSTVGSEVNNRGLFVQEVPAKAGELFKVAVSKFINFPPLAAESTEAQTARIADYLSDVTDAYHVHMFNATELGLDEMVVFDVPPAADPVCARRRGMEAIQAALHSNSRSPRAPLAPGLQMMTRQQVEALGVEMQSHPDQKFAVMDAKTSIFNRANDAAYSSDCTKAEYEAREQMNNAVLEMGVSADGILDQLYIRMTKTVAPGSEVFLTYSWPFWEDVRHKQDEFPQPCAGDVMWTGADTLPSLEDMMGAEQSAMQMDHSEATSTRHAHRASGSGAFAVLNPNLMPKNDVPAVTHGPGGVELHLSSRSKTGYQGVTYLTDKAREKPFRVKVGGGNIIGFYATALEGAIAYRSNAGAIPKPAGKTPTAAAEGKLAWPAKPSESRGSERRTQVWDSDVGEFVDARTGALWSLDAKQQDNRKRQAAPVRLRGEGQPRACRLRLEVTAELIEAPQCDAQPPSALMWQIGDRGAWEASDADLEAAFGTSAPLLPLSVPRSAMPAPMLNETGYSDERLLSYEQKRAQNIASNRRKLRALGLKETSSNRPRCVAPSDLTQARRDDADYVPERRADRVDQVQRPPSSRLKGQAAATNGAS